MSAPEHSTYIGNRRIRCAGGSEGTMPFARCHCGWEGPGQLQRSAAVEDGMQHLSAASAAAVEQASK